HAAGLPGPAAATGRAPEDRDDPADRRRGVGRGAQRRQHRHGDAVARRIDDVLGRLPHYRDRRRRARLRDRPPALTLMTPDDSDPTVKDLLAGKPLDDSVDDAT